MKIVELFAGVGGFRIGLERANKKFFDVIWSNQFEPSTKTQHASDVYCRAFGEENHINKDINLVDEKDIPDCDMIVGGFPCQDYSVAHTLSTSKGINGEKGRLWWKIVRIVKNKKPKILFLENVDRLLTSPNAQRGRDFALILCSLNNLGYYVEWRVINAADYGMPQRRKRIYILAYRKNTKIAKKIWLGNLNEWILQEGVLAKAFPCRQKGDVFRMGLPFEDIVNTEAFFNSANMIKKPFFSSGIMYEGEFATSEVIPNYQGEYLVIRDILESDIDEEYYISDNELSKWQYLKGSKTKERTSKDGYRYVYSEGKIEFPDSIDKPSRTIITSEGGRTPSRFKHVIMDPKTKRLRRLTSLELERLNMFPDEHTLGESDNIRAFLMGNALVCGVVTKIGQELYRRLKE